MRPRPLPKTSLSSLARDCYVTTIHSRTGQEVDEGHLGAGSLAKNVFAEPTEDGRKTTFLTSTDAGKHWYRVCTHEDPDHLFTTAHTDKKCVARRGLRLSTVGRGDTHPLKKRR
jgi:hypothetical protein